MSGAQRGVCSGAGADGCESPDKGAQCSARRVPGMPLFAEGMAGLTVQTDLCLPTGNILQSL